MGLQPYIFFIWFTSLSVNKFIIFWYNLLVHDLGPMMFRSSVVVRVVTLLCKRRIIAFDPYLNSWKGFKTGLEEMWLLLKASLRTKGWIRLKCIGFLWQRHNFVTVTKMMLLLLILYSYYFYTYTSLWKIILYFKKKIKIHDICDSHNNKRYI